MKTAKLRIDEVRVKSFVTLTDEQTNLTLKGGSSHDTEYDHCNAIYPKPFHLDENDWP